MARGCCGTEVIQCEERELGALHRDETRAVSVLLEHLRATRRHELLSRFTTALVLLACLAVFLFGRITPQPVDTACGNGLEKHHQQNGGPLALQQGNPDVIPQQGKPHAHLTTLSPTDPRHKCNRTPNQKTLAWEHEDGLAHTHRFHYEWSKQALIVPTTGFYTVYLQITFRIPSDFVCGRESCRMGAAVLAKWDNVEDPIMTVSETMPSSITSRKSVFASGIFRLKENTELRVNITDYTDITLVDRYGEHNTFFGAGFSYEANT